MLNFIFARVVCSFVIVSTTENDIEGKHNLTVRQTLVDGLIKLTGSNDF